MLTCILCGITISHVLSLCRRVCLNMTSGRCLCHHRPTVYPTMTLLSLAIAKQHLISQSSPSSQCRAADLPTSKYLQVLGL
ncbi:hypothetical protein GQ44DRAFT_720458 [Phaeosphaeriaceae sp. PMI808]|nr:hypothetical protein GQ44DRAFT_720458 [Phaeosphaeriaceae sp. PMI808]